jgi:hypothetical protein
MWIFNKLQNNLLRLHLVKLITSCKRRPRAPKCHVRLLLMSWEEHRSMRAKGTCLLGGHLKAGQAGLAMRQHLPLSGWAGAFELEPSRDSSPALHSPKVLQVTYSTTKLRMYSRSFCRLHWGRKVLLSSKTDTFFCLVSLKTWRRRSLEWIKSKKKGHFFVTKP